MIRYIVRRPIGTFMVLLALAFGGFYAVKRLPVSLLPNIKTPELTITAVYPEADARVIQETVATVLRNQLLQLSHLRDLETTSKDGQTSVKLRFEYGTDIDLAYLEANEKVDMLLDALPAEMPRPQVIKGGAADIPVFYLNVTQKSGNENFVALSDFCRQVLKRRLEQSSDIALVDITGLGSAEIQVDIRPNVIQGMGLSFENVEASLRSHLGEIGNLSIKDGVYEYNIKFDAKLRQLDDLKDLHLPLGNGQNRVIRLQDIADVHYQERSPDGIFTFNGTRAIGMAIIKREDARILDIRQQVESLTRHFERDYPELSFAITLDQSELLVLSVGNLINSLALGAILSFLMIFLFMRELRVLVLIGLVIPISLCITFLGFYLLGLSVNIVSLAGLVLGIGEIIDSAIIIIENIESRLMSPDGVENSVEDACITGTEEVIGPLFTSVLTNSVVYLPLLFLSGLAGAVFFDQAVAVTIALAVALFVSYTLMPVAYYLLFYKKVRVAHKDTITAFALKRLYQTVFDFAFAHPVLLASMWVLLMLTATWLARGLEREGMPDISRNRLETYIDWEEPLSVEENNRRIQLLSHAVQTKAQFTNVFVGNQQFLLNPNYKQSGSEAVVVSELRSANEYELLKKEVAQYLRSNYPLAAFESKPHQNAFEQLFLTSEPPLRILISNTLNNSLPTVEASDSLLAEIEKLGIAVQSPSPAKRRTLDLDFSSLARYDISYEQLIKVLRSRFGAIEAGVLATERQNVPILIGDSEEPVNLAESLRNLFVPNAKGVPVAAGNFISIRNENDYPVLYSGKEGQYLPIATNVAYSEVGAYESHLRKLARQFPGLSLRFEGSFYRNAGYLNELKSISAIALCLLFVILAAQFESLLQPLIVVFIVIFGISGAFIGLAVSGESLNIMSVIGMVVLMGLLDNDSILKIDTMNRSLPDSSLKQVIYSSGEKRLLSQIMTFATTVLGLLPILVSDGLGSDLQRPLAVTVIAGMVVGVIVSWTFIPLAYYWLLNRPGSRRF
jgi:multidrug efflux pump subunit AcrB